MKQIRSYLESNHYPLVDEILELLKFENNKSNQGTEFIVPPLKSDIPLSYRSIEDNGGDSTMVFGTTASTIKGYVQGGSSLEGQSGFVTYFFILT